MKAYNFVKYGCLFFTLALIGNTAWAQGLFPELSSIPVRGQKTEAKQIEEQQPVQSDLLDEDSDEQVQENEDTAQPEQAPTQNTVAQAPQTESSLGDDETDDDLKNPARIRMYITNINSTLTPVRAASYCFATLKLENQLNRPVQQFSATVTYGKFPFQFKAHNIAPGSTVFQNITLVGSACETLINAPRIDISACSVPKMSAEGCKDKFIFQEPTLDF